MLVRDAENAEFYYFMYFVVKPDFVFSPFRAFVMNQKKSLRALRLSGEKNKRRLCGEIKKC